MNTSKSQWGYCIWCDQPIDLDAFTNVDVFTLGRTNSLCDRCREYEDFNEEHEALGDLGLTAPEPRLD